MISRKTGLVTTMCAMSFKLMAATTFFANSPYDYPYHPWSLVTSIGYTDYNHMLEKDGQTPVMRLAFQRRFFAIRNFAFGLELGIQNGNTMDVDTTEFPELGGVPVSSTAKPPVDLLATLKTPPLFNTPIIGQVKGGIAYYHWQFDNNDTMKNQLKIASEVQAGVGFIINEFFDINIFYQGIFGGNPKMHDKPYVTDYSIDKVPVQHGVLISLDLNF